MTPTKRSNGQCTCGYIVGGLKTNGGHKPDCPALYPLQPHPGDEPDTLTKLTRLVRADGGEYEEQALALISEAAEERKALHEELAQWKRGSWVSFTEAKVMQSKLAAQQETITALSNKATAALRMGQQQGRVELATELLAMLLANPAAVQERLGEIIDEDM